MQLIFDFAEWTISPRQGIVGRQYDNLSHSLVVQGQLPEGYTWDMLVECQGHKNIIPLAPTECGASAPLTDDQLALNGYYAFQLRGTAATGGAIHHTNVASVYIPPTLVGPGTWPTLPTEFSQAEANIKELNAHPPVPGENGYWMLWDLDTHRYVQSQLVVPGLHIEIGETTTGKPGTPASVTNSGTNTAPVLNFTIPEGEKGDAATIQVGEVTASDPGSEPQVKNSGTENAAVFDFVLPRGQTGPTGPAATIEVESTVTGEPGTQASVENVGTTGAAKLRFTIPRGNTGQNGVTPTLAAGNVETLEPGQPATASVTGEGPEYQINLGIPQGKTGETGAQGVQGEIGPRGYTFTPAVDDAGNLSWTNDGGLPNPEEVNIKGPIGATGPQGNPGATPAISVGTVTTLDPGQDATAEITGETPNLTLNLGIPEGQPGQDGVQLNDNAVNTTEAWSSKKIVDSLCPPFSVSGNPVICHPVEDYPLSAVVSLEPKQAGTGDPSPENVRPISGYDSVTVTQTKDEAQVKQITLTLPETIYGGTVDAVTGVGDNTYIFKELAISDMDNSEDYPGWKNQEWVAQAIPGEILDRTLEQLGCVGLINICPTLKFRFNPLFDLYLSPNNDVFPGLTQAQIKEQYPDLVVQFCLKLVNPEPFQATGNQALPAVAGLNTIYTDGDNLDVSGRSDPLTTIQTMQAQITALQDQATQGGTA